MPDQEKALELYIKQLVDKFLLNPSTASRSLRELAAAAPDKFFGRSLGMLAESPDTKGYGYLALLVARAPGLCEMLTDPEKISGENAGVVVRKLVQADASVREKLAQSLSEKMKKSGGEVKNPLTEHVLDALRDPTAPPKILTESKSGGGPQMAAPVSPKMALELGRKLQNVEWARSIIRKSHDNRVRANAIEALWGKTTPDAKELFLECISDRNNRVAGNALIGLHLMGHEGVRDMTRHMAKDKRVGFRMTAAWAIAKIHHEELWPELFVLAEDVSDKVRTTVLRMLREHPKPITEEVTLQTTEPAPEIVADAMPEGVELPLVPAAVAREPEPMRPAARATESTTEQVAALEAATRGESIASRMHGLEATNRGEGLPAMMKGLEATKRGGSLLPATMDELKKPPKDEPAEDEEAKDTGEKFHFGLWVDGSRVG